MLRRVALVVTDVSEELSASFIRVARIDELGTTLAATSNRRTLRRFLQEPQGVTSQKTPLLIAFFNETRLKIFLAASVCVSFEECRLLGCYSVWLFKKGCFVGKYRLHHQGEKNGGSRNNVSSNYKPKHVVKKC
jgi:hypothetical protein